MLVAKPTHKKFANQKQFQFTAANSTGFFSINEKNPDNEMQELLDWISITGADKIMLTWTARQGHLNPSLLVWTRADGFTGQGGNL